MKKIKKYFIQIRCNVNDFKIETIMCISMNLMFSDANWFAYNWQVSGLRFRSILQ